MDAVLREWRVGLTVEGVGWARVGLADAEDEDEDEVVAVVADALVREGVGEAPADGELSAVVVAGALVGAVDGAEGEVGLLVEPSVSAPRVVLSVECEAPTSADTGRWPISSMPVTMPIATRKTAAVLTATQVQRGERRLAGRRGSRPAGSVRGVLVLGSPARGRAPVALSCVVTFRSRSLVLRSELL